MFALITFAISFLLIILIFGYKYWETSGGSSPIAGMRTKADRAVVRQMEYQRVAVPRMIGTGKRVSKLMCLHIMHYTALYVLSVVQVLERRLSGAVDFLRGRHHHVRRGRGPVSPFLRNVSEGKIARPRPRRRRRSEKE